MRTYLQTQSANQTIAKETYIAISFLVNAVTGEPTHQGKSTAVERLHNRSNAPSLSSPVMKPERRGQLCFDFSFVLWYHWREEQSFLSKPSLLEKVKVS